MNQGDVIELESLSERDGFGKIHQEQVSEVQSKLKIYKVQKHKKKAVKHKKACKWSAICLFVAIQIAIIVFLFANAESSQNKIQQDLDTNNKATDIKNPRKDNMFNNNQRNDKEKQQAVLINKNQAESQSKIQQQQHSKEQNKVPEAITRPQPKSFDNAYDVNGSFSLWDFNPQAKATIFNRYKMLPNDKKAPNDQKFMEINYGKDQEFLEYAKTYQKDIEVIDWYDKALTPEESTKLSYDFKFAQSERRTRIQRLVQKYKTQYNGKTGPIDPKKGVTYERFIESLQYQLLTGQNFKTDENSHLNQIYKKQKEYHQKTYKTHQFSQELHACIVIPTYNNEVDFRFAWNLQSILQQDYKNYRMIIIDDASTDNTSNRIAQHLKWRGVSQEKAVLIRGKKHRTALQNIYYSLHKYCNYNQLFYIIDGDDEIIGTQVFSLYNTLFRRKKLYMLYSTHFQYDQKNTTSPLVLGLPYAYPESVKQKSDYRIYYHAYSQLRTVMSDMFLLLKMSSLKDQNGNFYWTIYDNALYFPAMEMSCGRVDYVPELEYWYTSNTGINDWRTPRQGEYGKVARHIKFTQKHYKCIHSTIKEIEAGLNAVARY